MPTNTTANNSIAFAGDIHGRLDAFEHTLAAALSRGVRTVIWCGDYWIYDIPHAMTKLSRIIARICRDFDADPDALDLRFIDGNHENFAVLTPAARTGSPVPGPVRFMPRGSVDTINGVRILFCGGASSVDVAWRTPGVDWWPDENLTLAQIERAEAAAGDAPVDILVTHETTREVFEELLDRGGHAREKIGDPAGDRNRELLSRLVTTTSPRFHVHGHHHTFHTTVARDGRPGTVSLSLEKAPGSVAIFDPDAGTWTKVVARREVPGVTDDEPLHL